MHARVAMWLIAIVLFGAGAGAQAADLGSAPSGEVPIIFNDHTVYAKPDTLRRGRVLAALVKGGQIYVPLRSMFEAMGATVEVSPDGKTVTAEKPGGSVSVTLGKAEVVINGESRPLDVPPMVYRGVMLVPVRVISEGLGAYVQWVPEKRVVVVRFIPAPIPPPPAVIPATPAPTAPPTMAPVPTPTPTLPPREYRGFVEAAVYAPRSYNEFSAGEFCPDTYIFNAAYLFKHSPLAVKVDYRQDAYVTSDNATDAFANHFTGFATIDGGFAFTSVFLAKQSTFDARVEYEVAAPRIYVGVGYLKAQNNYGYPNLSGAGLGIEKLPDMRSGINLFGSIFYYPTATGTYTVDNVLSPNNGVRYHQQYGITKYDIGLALTSRRLPVYLYGGVAGDHYGPNQNAPIGQTHDGPYIGLGVKF